MYSRAILDDIRGRISIVAVVGERIPLKRAGRNSIGLCPFHSEKTPSFNVNDEKGIYHCFGCGEGGDVFQFLMKFEGMGFTEAVEQLAAKAGVALPIDTDPRERAAEEEAAKRRKRLIRVNEIARDFFQGALADGERGKAARNYLSGRGIAAERITQHFLGYADNSWDALARHLEAQGVPLTLAAELGLVKAREAGGGYYDFFRHRIVFPILSPRGEVIGFGGRALEGGIDGEPAAKYLNSPDSPIYHKSNCVYGLDRTAGAIRAADQAALVEGYMDFIALHQAGIQNVVAPLGTALTPGHIALVARLTRAMVLVFDGDEAGQRAGMRALPLFLEAGLMPRVVVLPPGEDPDTLVRKEGAEAFRRRIAAAKPLFEHFVEATVARTGLDSAGKVAALRQIAPLVARVGDPVEAAVLRQHVARRLDVEEQSVARASAAAPRERRKAAERAEASRAGQAREQDAAADDADRRAERLLIQAMLAEPARMSEVFETVGPAQFDDEWCRTVAGLLLAAWRETEAVDIGALIDGLADDELASQLRAMALGRGSEDPAATEELVRDCVERLRARPTVARLAAINEELRRAEGDGDDGRVLALLAEKRALVNQVHGRATDN
jgi:DNA primase